MKYEITYYSILRLGIKYSDQYCVILGKENHRGQWNRIKRTETTTQIWPNDLFFNKGGKPTQWRRDGLFKNETIRYSFKKKNFESGTDYKS